MKPFPFQISVWDNLGGRGVFAIRRRAPKSRIHEEASLRVSRFGVWDSEL